jgi:hypothetical protein
MMCKEKARERRSARRGESLVLSLLSSGFANLVVEGDVNTVLTITIN